MTELLAIGHVARDELGDGEWRLGGGALYGAVTAARLGRSATLVTRVADAERGPLEELCRHEGVELHALPSLVTTTFAISYDDTGMRKLVLRARARAIAAGDLPTIDEPAAVLFASIAHELPGELFSAVGGRARVLAAQGFLREWSADGKVTPRVWADAEQVLAAANAIAVLSEEDLGGDASVAGGWSKVAPVVVTVGDRGACLYEAGAATPVAASRAERVVDAIGAGDAFAAALALALADGQGLHDAVRYANAVASFAVEGVGFAGLADSARVDERVARARSATR